MTLPVPEPLKIRTGNSLMRSVKLVAWAFLGIRKGSEYKQDFAEVKPLHVVFVGVLLAVAFVLALVGLVNWVVAG